MSSQRLVQCVHWEDRGRPDRGGCRLGLFGGAPRHATCLADCDRYEKPSQAVTPTETPNSAPHSITSPRRIACINQQSPGDVVVLTGAIRDLQLAHPGRFDVLMHTAAPQLWRHNPHVSVMRDAGQLRRREIIKCEYPAIHQSNQRRIHFMQAFVEDLERKLGVTIPVTRCAGDIHLSDEERRRPAELPAVDRGKPCWIIVAGGKYDFTAKWWSPAAYQQVVDHFRGVIQFVQCGEAGHWHEPLDGVINLVGKTDVRQFLRVMHHARGVVCPVTFAMHAAAAVPTTDGSARPCVVVAGGREPPHWERYPGHRFLHTVGQLDCCRHGGCWKSRCQTVGDGDDKDRRDLCEFPVQVRRDLHVPECMHMIEPADVIRAIEGFLDPTPADGGNGSADREKPGEVREVRDVGNVRDAPNVRQSRDRSSQQIDTPPLNDKLHERAFAVVSDSRFFPGLMALLNSIHAYHGDSLRVFVLAHGFTAAQLSAVRRHPLRHAITLLEDPRAHGKPAGMWEAKQQVFDIVMTHARIVCLLDADLVLLSRLDDVFDLAAKGNIVSCRDGEHRIHFDDRYATYSEQVVGERMDYFNTGFLCLDVVGHWDLAAMWSFASRFAAYSPGGGAPLRLQGHGDQGVFNALVAMQKKQAYLHLFDQDEWCNSGHWSSDRSVTITQRDGQRLIVRNNMTGNRQRLLHSTGPKWWTSEGRRHFRSCGDVLESFQHFERMGEAAAAL